MKTWEIIFLWYLFCAILGSAVCAHGQDEVLKTPAVLAAITQLHNHVHRGGDKTEWSVVVHADGTPSALQSSGDSSHNVLRVRIGSDLAIIHSHPDGVGPEPSHSDQVVAKDCGIPNYEVSGYYIYVAEPDGKTIRKVADIEQGGIKWRSISMKTST